LEVCGGSETNFKAGHFNFESIKQSGNATIQKNPEDILTRRHLTLDHLSAMRYLQQNGNFGAHQLQCLLTVDE
jgi:hypothetical protein